MNRSLYTASTGMLYNQKSIDAISNNLANTNTNGFKRDMTVAESFPDVLVSKINDDSRNVIGHQPFEGVTQNEAEDGVYSLSINSGFFKVGTPAGTSNNRDLKFVVDDNGYLRTFSRDSNSDRQYVGENFVLDNSGDPIQVGNPDDVQVEANGNVVSGGEVVANMVSFPPNHVIGSINGGVRLSRVGTDFGNGTFTETGDPLNFAIQGNGFFKVTDGEGNQFYTRDGSFTRNTDGTLITKDGYTVVGTDGPIVIPGGGEIGVSDGINITSDGEVIGTLDVVDLENRHELRKYGHNLFTMEEGFEAEEIAIEGSVISKHLEGSNVVAVKEMVNMINAYRNYESNQKVITTQDELLSKVASELGKV